MDFAKKHPATILGLVATLLMLGCSFIGIDFLDILELKFYDFRMAVASGQSETDKIVIVDIDDDSIEKLGRWPWPRSLIADAIRKINQGHPRVIGLNIIYSEPEESKGLSELKQLESLFSQTLLMNTGDEGLQFLDAINASLFRLDSDNKLTEALAAAENVVLPVFFKNTVVQADDSKEPPPILVEQSIRNVKINEGATAPLADQIILPIPKFLNSAKGIGHINFSCDMDGTTRREQLLFDYQGLYIPSYTLKLAALYMNLTPNDIWAEIGTAVHIGAVSIPVTLNSELLVSFKGPRGSFKRYSFFDVYNDKIAQSVFNNKLVLISTSAAGIMNPLAAPTDPSLPIGEFTANTIWTVLNQNFIRQPSWAATAELLGIVIIGMLVSLLLPRLKALTAGLGFLGVLVLLVGGSIYLFAAKGLWLQISYPAVLLVIGYIGGVSINYFMTETRKDEVEGESAETNRMLGVSFQSQGMLDMAFDKFRRVPVNDEVKDLLYNLALDFERKRQFNKAASVYEYIEQHDSSYKDASDRKKKLIQASDTMVFGNGFLGSGKEDSLVSEGADIRPTLGRYEVTRQLGKGAMGVVYMGQDPRINRTTAIKTFRFTDEFEPDEIDELKKKFFREAESAGTLSHPNIVTIYDAGEEQDLAYIAMEYLEGGDLQKYTKKSKLMPIRKVIGYMADIAAALDYAHAQGIVHRDIKPANIMLLKSGLVKITDFGIARITASSQTRTGVVKGTPYYMSPEQISGKKVDGRSDIFSLGTMMYQLLTGHVPFDGDSPAALMHQILDVPHPDPRKYNPKIPKLLVMIINKALEKDYEKRYQKASQMASHLKQLGDKIDNMASQKKKNS